MAGFEVKTVLLGLLPALLSMVLGHPWGLDFAVFVLTMLLIYLLLNKPEQLYTAAQVTREELAVGRRAPSAGDATVDDAQGGRARTGQRKASGSSTYDECSPDYDFADSPEPAVNGGPNHAGRGGRSSKGKAPAATATVEGDAGTADRLRGELRALQRRAVLLSILSPAVGWAIITYMSELSHGPLMSLLNPVYFAIAASFRPIVLVTDFWKARAVEIHEELATPGALSGIAADMLAVRARLSSAEGHLETLRAEFDQSMGRVTRIVSNSHHTVRSAQEEALRRIDALEERLARERSEQERAVVLHQPRDLTWRSMLKWEPVTAKAWRLAWLVVKTVAQ